MLLIIVMIISTVTSELTENSEVLAEGTNIACFSNGSCVLENGTGEALAFSDFLTDLSFALQLLFALSV